MDGGFAAAAIAVFAHRVAVEGALALDLHHLLATLEHLDGALERGDVSAHVGDDLRHVRVVGELGDEFAARAKCR